MKTPHDSTWLWRRVIENRPIARKLLGSMIGDGASTSFLQDNWHPKDGTWIFPSPCSDNALTSFHQISIVDINVNEKDLVVWRPSTSEKFTMKDTYKAIFPHGDPIFWHYIVWFKLHIPRHSLIAWVALYGRLKTRDKLIKRGVSENENCVLCDTGRESEARP
ncbi:uncharacterized protein LOC113291242 [Papaver somniferum]|uniref:uncharacterized protein LOC113291242 n=1 Tax=Papaver somniferum TaxID=3469 RepID=UPI000E6F600D|nr:uncharacterized protein LOC113291242 [Papaver somniferum]